MISIRLIDPSPANVVFLKSNGEYERAAPGEFKLIALVNPDGCAIAWDIYFTNNFYFGKGQYIDLGPYDASKEESKDKTAQSFHSSIRDLIGQDMTSINIQFRGEK